MKTRIPTKLYKKILDVLPILCVDIVIKEKGKFLLVKRKLEPRKREWWVPGGRILKGEIMEKAALRKVKEETGIDIKILKAIGYYEDQFKENEFGLKNKTHFLSIVFLAKPLSLDIKLDSQSSEWKFSQNLPKDFKIKQFNYE